MVVWADESCSGLASLISVVEGKTKMTRQDDYLTQLRLKCVVISV